MPRPSRVAACGFLGLLLLGCTHGDAASDAARSAFEGFQDALFGGDAKALAATLSRGSREAMDQIPLDRTRGKQRLVVTGVRPFPPEFEIAISDPNENGRAGTFVVVREDGRYVVDLVATAGFHKVEDAAAKRSWRIEPRALAPHERARAEALATRMRSR